MMVTENIIDRQKRQADAINLVILIAGVLILPLFLKLTFIMSIIIYPMFSLLIYGTLKIQKGFSKKLNNVPIKVLNVLFGIGCILFGLFLIIFIFSFPNADLYQIINLLAFPVIIIGLSGMVKGIIIREYPYKYRAMNIYIGIITVIIAIIAFILTGIGFIFHIFSLAITILLNIISRAAMYLSQFKLSLKFRNLRYFIYIINDYPEFEILRRIMLRRLMKNE
ncbi:MAG: hypothetical protein ACFFDX_06380 [Candidatus Odinarchaeota archaeon]